MRARGASAMSKETSAPERSASGAPEAEGAAHGHPSTSRWEPLRSTLAYWRWASRLAGIWLARSGGPGAVETARRERFDALVVHARANSPYYRRAYRSLPERGVDPSTLPVTTKRELMARFDDWATDREITLEGCRAFIGDPTRIGTQYLGRYVLWTSSGSTGEPAIYVQDADALATFDALMAAHFDPTRMAMPLLARGGRAALVAATGDHFASVASWQRLCRMSPWIGARVFSILDPLPAIVAGLNAYRPSFVASYPTMLAELASEQRAGRLRIAPAQLWSGGECLASGTCTEIESAFGAAVVNEYGASECMSIAYGCREGWLHVNADWVLLEPVDRAFRPTPPGEPSQTVLLTNLANRVQPIIRYDLGDSVLAKPEPCACGSALPAIRVEGRHDDVVSLAAADGRIVRLPPLALTTVIEQAAHVTRFQIVQSDPDRLLLRLEPCGAAQRRAVWEAAADGLRRYLAHQSLSNVRIGLDDKRPVPDRRSGKLREVVVARAAASKPARATEA